MGSLYKRKNSPYWWIRIYVNGQRKYFSTKTKEKSKARRILNVVEGKVAFTNILEKMRGSINDFHPAAGGDNKNNCWIKKRWNFLNTRERQAVIFTLFKGRCYYCGRKVRIPLKRDKQFKPDRCVIDHKVPISGGGADTLDNIVLACHECNQRKSEKHADEFINEIIHSIKIEQD